jgi:hypothetical protein
MSPRKRADLLANIEQCVRVAFPAIGVSTQGHLTSKATMASDVQAVIRTFYSNAVLLKPHTYFLFESLRICRYLSFDFLIPDETLPPNTSNLRALWASEEDWNYLTNGMSRSHLQEVSESICDNKLFGLARFTVTKPDISAMTYEQRIECCRSPERLMFPMMVVLERICLSNAKGL